MARPCKRGGIGFIARIRIERDGAVVYKESRTFGPKWAAEAGSGDRKQGYLFNGCC